MNYSNLQHFIFFDLPSFFLADGNVNIQWENEPVLMILSPHS